MAPAQEYYREEEAFWQRRQAKLRQMSGHETTEQDSLKHQNGENIYVASSGDALQLEWKRSAETWAHRVPLISLHTNHGTGNRTALEVHKQILAMAEIREDVEQHLRRIKGQRQLLTEQKVAEQRRLIRLLDAQLRESCQSCNAQERELKDLLAEVLGQLHAYTGMLEGSTSMPDEATLSDLPARVEYLQRKKTLLLACTQPSSALQMSLAAQPPALAPKAPTGLLLGAQQPDEAMRALRQAVGLPAAEDRVNVAESLLGQSPDAKSSNPTRQLKRAYAAMLQAVKENHLAEKENLIRACHKELCQQKAAYERAITEVLNRQQAHRAKDAKETAAEALRSHPLAETPTREPQAKHAHSSPLEDGPIPRMPVLRCSPLGERQRPRSASLQRLSSARRKPLATLGAAAAAAGAQSLQHPPAGAHQAAGLATAGSEICTRQHNALAALDVHAQPTEGCALSSACRRPAAEVAAAEEDHGLLSPISLPGSEDTPGKVQGPADWAPAGRTAAPGSTAPAASSAQREAVTRPPFQAAQPPMTSTGSGAIARQAKIAAQGGRRPDIAQTARHPPTKPQSTGFKEDVIQASAGTSRKCSMLLPSSRVAGSVRAGTGAESIQSGLASPVSLDDSPLPKGRSQGMALPKELGGASGPGSPTYKALAQHAASIETFLAGGDASMSARDESTALAQLMQVLNDKADEL